MVAGDAAGGAPHGVGAPNGIGARFGPVLLLALALSWLFVCRADTGYFYHARSGHNWDSAKNLAVAENLSLEHRLRLYTRLVAQPDGTARYWMYSRFPVGGSALIKLAMLPFDGDLAAKIHAARTLMLVFFCAAAVLAFDALRRILGDAWAAVAATLLAFSSDHMLYYSDAVTTEGSVDLFAVLLVFHGMVLHARHGRFAQLVAKTCCALLLGWHVYGLLLAFLGVGLAAQLTGVWRARPQRPWLARARDVAGAFARGRPLALGAVAVCFGAGVLGFNLANEHAAHDGAVSFAELPSVRSMLKRTGWQAQFNAARAEQLAWPSFLYWQLRAIGTAVTPQALALPRFRATLGALVLATLLIWLLRARLRPGAKALLGTLALCGFCWTLPMRHNAAFHVYEHLFYVGVPLTLFGLAGARLRKLRRGNGVAVAAGGVAAVLFVCSAALAKAAAVDRDAVAVQKPMLAEFDGIRETTRGKTVFVAFDADLADAYALDVTPAPVMYFLAGSVLQFDGRSRRRRAAPFAAPAPTTTPLPNPAPHRSSFRVRAYDFIVVLGQSAALGKDEGDPSLLTPDNRYALLYDGGSFASVNDFYRHWYGLQYAATASGEPVARSVFEVYPHGRELAYLKTPCGAEHAAGAFFVHVFPARSASLPAAARARGFDRLDFRFADHGAVFDGRCMARIRLPNYAIARIATGQRVPAEGAPWRVVVLPEPGRRQKPIANVRTEPFHSPRGVAPAGP